MMKKLYTITSLLLLAGLISAPFLASGKASAVSFNPNRIIDDIAFDNTHTMNAAQIDAWINGSFGAASCISTAHGFSAPDPIGYNPSQGFLYGGNVSAGQI